MPILREKLGLPAGHNETQRHDRCLDRQRRFAQGRLRAASGAARSRRHVSRSDRSTSRLVSIVAHDQHRAEQSRAVQNLRHAWLRCRSRREENFEIEHLRQTDGRRPFRRPSTAPIWFGFGPAASITPTDVPFSEEMFTRLGDTYRRIRNTLRILLGNLYDFPL